MLALIEYLGMPGKITAVIVTAVLFMQLVGEFLEFKGNTVPEIMKFRKIWRRKKLEREAISKLPELLIKNDETSKTLHETNKLLESVDKHYSEDNISKRNKWMNWVNERAEVYDSSIIEISRRLEDVTLALKENTKLTEEMFIQSSRDRIISFSRIASNEDAMISIEEFRRIEKVYEDYEKYLEDHGLKNGEVAVAHQVIMDAYEDRLRSNTFTEYIRGYR